MSSEGSDSGLPKHRPRFAVLVSGRGSNLQAILDAELDADCVGVLSSNPRALGLSVASEHGVPTAVVDARGPWASRDDYDAALERQLRAWQAEWVVLAGFMRILTDGFVRRWPNRIVNIHPSLLPAYPGLAPQRQALEDGAAESGCTVHLVAPGDVDSGPVIAQRSVPVLEGDDEASLSARILEAEHGLYPATLRELFSRRG